jgi:dehydrogenase/reductase SDR family member 7B
MFVEIYFIIAIKKANLTDKVVIITGASSGIGKALAEEFAREKASVVIAARRREKLEALRDSLSKFGSEVLVVVTDVSKEEDCKRLIEETVARFGHIDILINNAGVSMRALFKDLSLEVVHKLMDVNFWGTVYCTHYALKYLLESKGSVVGVSSIAGSKGLPGRTGYSSSKFAVQGFLETLRIENRKTGLHVLTACPWFTTSEIRLTALVADGSAQGESPRNETNLMSAEKVARKIIRAIRRRRNFLVITIQGKLLILLNKFLPRILDRIIYNQMAKEPDSPFK